MVGADLFWEKNITDWLVAEANLVWEKSTAGWLADKPAEQNATNGEWKELSTE